MSKTLSIQNLLPTSMNYCYLFINIKKINVVINCDKKIVLQINKLPNWNKIKSYFEKMVINTTL